MKKLLYLLVIILCFSACSKDEPTKEDEFPEDSGVFTDTRDGNTYKWVRIGEQNWTAENMAYLPVVSLKTEFSDTEPCYYVNRYYGTSISDAKTTNIYNTYGVLYNWPAAKEACPDGWHLPTYADWEQLAEYISNDNSGYIRYTFGHWGDVGKHLKSKGTFEDGDGLWEGRWPGTIGADDYGFSGHPGGYFSFYSGFGGIGSFGAWYGFSRSSGLYGNYRALKSSDNTLWNETSSINAFSVRCVKD